MARLTGDALRYILCSLLGVEDPSIPTVLITGVSPHSEDLFLCMANELCRRGYHNVEIREGVVMLTDLTNELRRRFFMLEAFLGLLAAFLSGVFFTLGISAALTLPQRSVLFAIALALMYMAWRAVNDAGDSLLGR